MMGVETNLGKWDDWYRDFHAHAPDPFLYGDTVTYRMAAAFLVDVATVEDWGCGAGGFRRFCKSVYVGIDGSQTPFADRIVDLCQYQSRVEGILIRHVLEHNDAWEGVLENAVRSFTKKLCLILFTPFGETTQVLSRNCHGVNVPDISFCRSDIERKLTGLRWELFDNIPTTTQYGIEHVYMIWRNNGCP